MFYMQDVDLDAILIFSFILTLQVLLGFATTEISFTVIISAPPIHLLIVATSSFLSSGFCMEL